MLRLLGIMNRTIPTTWAFALILTPLAACTGDAERYPSLAIRDVERVEGLIVPAAAVEPAELPIRSLAPTTGIDALVAQASETHRTFVARQPAARSLASRARGTGRDSEARGQAIVALADLSSLRSQTEFALADLDMLVAERTNRLEPADDAIAAHAQVLALVNEQDRTLNSLWGLLGK